MTKKKRPTRSAVRTPRTALRKVAAWVKNPSDEVAVAEGCTFDEAAGLHKVAFFEKFLRHSKGQWAGKAFTLLPWQRDGVIMPLFGWRRPDGTRRFREGFLGIPKKNGKSTMGSGLTLNMMLADGEPGAEVYGAAADREQASIVFREAAEMRKASKPLEDRTTSVDSRKRIYSIDGSFYQVLSADAFRSEGINAHFTLFDELHAQRWRTLYDALKWAGAARRQPLFLSISTAGEDQEHSLCGEVWTYAQRVLEGQVKDTGFFSVIYAAAKGDDWKNPATWAKANPSYGAAISEDEMRRASIEAEAKPSLLSAFLRYRLNIWPEGVAAAWLDLDAWRACPRLRSPDLAALEGQVCFGGLDHSSKVDLTSFALWFPEAGALLVWFWCPAETMRRRSQVDRVDYPTWAAAGHITATEGNQVDYRVMWRHVEDCARRYRMISVRVDGWNATATFNHFAEKEITAREFGQGYRSMTEAAKTFEASILDGKIRTMANPVMDWCVGNVVVKTDDAGNIKPSKDKSREKIDGVVAAIMAMAEPDEEERKALGGSGDVAVFL